MVNFKQIYWKKIYLILLIIIFICSILILIEGKNIKDNTIIDYVKGHCINANEIIPLLNDTNIEYGIQINNGNCLLINKENGK